MSHFGYVAAHTPIGVRATAFLQADPRVKALEGHMINTGGGGGSFSVAQLATWFLWYAYKHGTSVAAAHLDAWLDASEVQVYVALWVTGVTCTAPIEIAEGVRLVPLKDMPASYNKDDFSAEMFQGSGVSPAAALVCTCPVTRSYPIRYVPSGGLAGGPREDEFWRRHARLEELAFLCNAMTGVICMPYMQSSYLAEHVPLGAYAGGGGGLPSYNAAPVRNEPFPLAQLDMLGTVMRSFDAAVPGRQRRFLTALHRLSLAKRQIRIEDQVLDLAIALEMLLLESSSNTDQLSLQFRLRGSWLVGEDLEDRLAIYQLLHGLYNYRSQVAHSGTLCGGDWKKIGKVQETFPQYIALAEKIVRASIIGPAPDWKRLLLGESGR